MSSSDHKAFVLAAVIARAGSVGSALDAIEAQVYEPESVAVVGGGDAEREAAGVRGMTWVASPGELAGVLGSDTTHVWVLHDDALPRPDALGALVSELERTDASVAGAKLLRSDNSDMLELVGAATDVFGVPYTGLEDNERDQEQYDVVRDVAYVSGACMLVRRDLFLGLGGPDTTMAPNAAGIDFSQRARIAGGRVVVVPSAEVLHEGSCETGPSWREDAGQIRAVAKAYRGLTLAWVLPGAFATGLISALVHTLLDRRNALLHFLFAWGWNVRRLPSTIGERHRMRRARLVGDEELFRYQVKGSVALKEVAELLGDRLRERTTEGRFEELVDRGRNFWQQPGFIASIAVVLFAVVATRSIWGVRLPVGGFSLPLPESARATLIEYAGGWNPAGLGGASPMMPVVGAAALVQLILFSKAGLASAVLTVGALIGGLWGAGRMLGRLGIGQWGRIVGALALVGGPAARVLGQADAWPGLLALGVAPWAIAIALRPWPQPWWDRIARVAGLGLSTGALAVFAPVGLVVPLVALVLGALVKGGWGSVVRGAIGAVLAIPLLLPWFYSISPGELLDGPSLYWSPSIWVVGLMAGIAVLVVTVGDREMAAIGGLGAALVAGGAAVARTSGVGGGYEVSVAGLVLASVGAALLAGASVDLGGRFATSVLSRRVLAAIGAIGGVVLAVGALAMVPAGRAGLGADQFGAPLAFTTARASVDGPDRILLVGEHETDLPGTSRAGDGYWFRVIDGPAPTLTQGRLPDPGLGDEALTATLQNILSGELRPGEALAAYGVRWVVLIGATPFDTAFDAQLDMKPLPGLGFTVFESEVRSPVAESSDGLTWTWMPPRFEGEPADRVLLKVNANQGWGPGWTQSEWANEVDGSQGVAEFTPDATLRLLAEAAGVYLLLLIGVSAFVRSRS
ncbi:MAG: glycosyltransferase [Acidimicrobiia bacterium]